MHHSDFITHQHLSHPEHLSHQRFENDEEIAWIRRYNHRKASQDAARKERKIDMIYWILSILLLLSVLNFPSILKFIFS